MGIAGPSRHGTALGKRLRTAAPAGGPGTLPRGCPRGTHRAEAEPSQPRAPAAPRAGAQRAAGSGAQRLPQPRRKVPGRGEPRLLRSPPRAATGPQTPARLWRATRRGRVRCGAPAPRPRPCPAAAATQTRPEPAAARARP